jgi:hypothetical protein
LPQVVSKITLKVNIPMDTRYVSNQITL